MQGRRQTALGDRQAEHISTRAPRWGRHSRWICWRSLQHISTHAPCGSDLYTCAQITTKLHFNPRPHAGRYVLARHKIQRFLISIHAPVWGRRQQGSHTGRAQNFNPRPRVGATTVYTINNPDVTEFQPTPPCGGDVLLTPARRAARISIHAPYRGDHPQLLAVFVGGISIHASDHEAPARVD